MSETSQEQELRIVLDGPATKAFKTMVERMKVEIPTVKVQPSNFVSFLVADFLETHFEKDMAVLIAEFFDSDAYYEAERKKAKGTANYEELMASALAEARKIKAKARRRATRKHRQLGKPMEAKANETV
jgi:hypothetical protein